MTIIELLKLQQSITIKENTIKLLKTQINNSNISEKKLLIKTINEYTRSKKHLETALNNEINK